MNKGKARIEKVDKWLASLEKGPKNDNISQVLKNKQGHVSTKMDFQKTSLLPKDFRPSLPISNNHEDEILKSITFNEKESQIHELMPLSTLSIPTQLTTLTVFDIIPHGVNCTSYTPFHLLAELLPQPLREKPASIYAQIHDSGQRHKPAIERTRGKDSPVAVTSMPGGRLKAWRECGGSDDLGYRFELIPDTNDGISVAGIVLAESMLSSNRGRKFVIDMSYRDNSGSNARTTLGSATSLACSPRSSGDYGYGLWSYCMYRGFVMSTSVEGEKRCSKLTVQMSVPHVNCTEDVAVFVTLVVAIDLSVDACRFFSQQLRNELY
ncbi:hypothetical protein Fmac_008573 [Flemingia macrophylla]|uniref:Uncharacterized protein n=1 Tax=Flemingia macrophylla TaxID=520843 RepID=A0ABD1MXT0_9FABA